MDLESKLGLGRPFGEARCIGHKVGSVMSWVVGSVGFRGPFIS